MVSVLNKILANLFLFVKQLNLFSSLARDVVRGRAAVEDLEKTGLRAKFHQLDVTDHSSIVQLRDFLQENYGGLDILVNNAGVAFLEVSISIAKCVCMSLYV